MLDECCPRIVLMAKPTSPSAVCKSVPDFESVSAMWVDAKDLSKLTNPDDYRGPDPVKYFPGLANGDLKVQPLDTNAFKELEKLIV
jgi:hypothetical protein